MPDANRWPWTMTRLHKQIVRYRPLIEDIVVSSESCYFFTHVDYFSTLVANRDFSGANRIYVLEIISRLHAAALITLRRNLSWIESIEVSYGQSAFFAFCASLRGMIESSADSYFSLRHVPLNLAQYFEIFVGCISGTQSENLHIFKELEDFGIHFLEAGRYDDKSRDKGHYKAKKTWEYIQAIDSDPFFGKVYPLYQELCQISHPSRESTYLHFSSVNNAWSVRTIDFESRIERLLSVPDVDYDAIFQASFNAALITIWIIDQFRITGMMCPQIRSVNFDSIAGFKKIKDKLRKKR